MSFICVNCFIKQLTNNTCGLRALRTVEAILTVQAPDNALVYTGGAGQLLGKQQRDNQCRGPISTNTNM